MGLQIINLDPDRPRRRQLALVAEAVQRQAVIALPSDSGYSFICHPLHVKAVDKMRQLRQLPKGHHLTLLCPNLSALGEWAQVDTPSYRLLRRLTPGPYTFIVLAGKEAPKKIQHPKRRTMGLRFPDSPLLQMLMELCDSPLLTTTLTLPGVSTPAEEIEDIERACQNGVQYLLSVGDKAYEPTTVLDLCTSPPELLRQGAGDISTLS